ncbi:MAG: type I-U CRISPR-associated protein Cas5/Cas6 [Acidobacterium ailaaui]|nr:type I-U CRISPR-associated protein Cas5/Cas6 [Pseudacidobacterium ailaaui]
MLAIAFTFPAGRYHATPWDRHVNEGAIVWPPEPWRVLRALIATWQHKVKPLGRHEESTLRGLIEALSQSLPEYSLPAASHSHTRHYMPQWKSGETSLVFDAFASVCRKEPLIMAWPGLDLCPEQLALLDDLLAVMGYLGRAESWIEAVRFEGRFQPNCRPEIDPSDSESVEERVTLLAPLRPEDYDSFRNSFLADKDNKKAKRLAKTLPENLLDALSVETSNLRTQGWSQPPAARKQFYRRPAEALRPRRKPQPATSRTATTARYLLIGKPLPRVEETVRIGELFRRAVMSEAKRLLGEGAIPAFISGHGLPNENRHRHAFYLPWDQNNDGRIDHLILYLPDRMDLETRQIAERLKRIWSHDGGEWQVVLENIGEAEAGGNLLAKVSEWESVTPYLHPWHVKRGFDVAAQIRRECAMRGLPEPIQLTSLKEIPVGNQLRRPLDFRRHREKRGLMQPDRRGSFWRIRFPEPVDGPIALGFGCHFGLGLFCPADGA